MPDISAQDRDLVARTILSEAGNDGASGMAAVANVIKNRTDSGRYGDNPSDVVMQRKQFEPWSLPRTDSNHPSRWSSKSEDYRRASDIVDSVWKGETPDATGGATHFYSPKDQTALGRKAPEWGSGKPLATVGHHQFFAPEGAVTPDLLGSWGAPAAATPATGGESDDLLGAWNTGEPAAPPSDNRLRITIHPKSDAIAPEHETIPQFLNRIVADAHGHGDANVSSLITGNRPDSWTDASVKLAGGVGRGVGDVGDTLAQGIVAAGTGGAGLLERAGVIAPQTAEKVRQWGAGVNQDITRDQVGFDQAAGVSGLVAGGRIAGQVAGSAPFLGIAGRAAMAPVNAVTRVSPGIARFVAQPGALTRGAQIVGTGAAGGAGAAALTSSVSDQPLADQVIGGGVAGAALGPIAHGVGRLGNAVFGSGVSPATAALARTARDQYGIPVTAGQISENPTIRFLDSVLQRLPLTGYGARTEQQLAGVNREVAQTFGEHTDAITPDTIRAAKTRLGQVFNDVAARTGPIQFDHPAANEMTRILRDAAVAPENVTNAVRNQVRNIISAVDPTTGAISPEAYQALTRKGAPLGLAQKGGERTVAHYANQLREVVDDMMQRSAPADVAHDLAMARSQWRAMKTIEPLAEKAGPNGISPSLIRGVVNKAYPNTARAPGVNEQTLRDIGQIGQRFLKEPPSSGTSERLMIRQHLSQLIGAAGLGSLGTATYFDPDSWQRNALLAAGSIGAGRVAGSALRSNVLTNAMIRAGLRGPIGGGAAQEILNRTLPVAGALTHREPLRLTVHPAATQ